MTSGHRIIRRSKAAISAPEALTFDERRHPVSHVCGVNERGMSAYDTGRFEPAHPAHARRSRSPQFLGEIAEPAPIVLLQQSQEPQIGRIESRARHTISCNKSTMRRAVYFTCFTLTTAELEHVSRFVKRALPSPCDKRVR